MIAALVRRNLRHQRWLLAGLFVGLIGWSVLLIRIGAEFASGSQLEQLLALLPAFLRDFVGSQIGGASFPAFVGFTFQHPAIVGLSLAFMILAGTTPAGERDAGTLELMLARPLPRSRYLVAVIVTIIVDAIILSASILTGIIVGLGVVDAPEAVAWTQYVPSAAASMLLNLAVAGCALLAAVCAPRRGTAVAGIVAVIFVLYVVEIFADMWPPLASIRWISPFHYFKPVDAVVRAEPHARNDLVLFALFAVTTASALVIFRRRDI